MHGRLRPPPMLPNAADARGPGASSSHRFSCGFVGLRAHGIQTQLMLMMLSLGWFSRGRNLVNTECFWAPRKNTPKPVHFTCGNGFMPTKHPKSKTPNALNSLRAFGVLLLGVSWACQRSSTYYGVFRGFWMAWGRPLMLMMLPFLGPKTLPRQKKVFTAFSQGFSV